MEKWYNKGTDSSTTIIWFCAIKMNTFTVPMFP